MRRESREYCINMLINEKEKYLKIHDGVWAQIHFNARKKLLAKPEDEQWYEYVPKPV